MAAPSRKQAAEAAVSPVQDEKVPGISKSHFDAALAELKTVVSETDDAATVMLDVAEYLGRLTRTTNVRREDIEQAMMRLLEISGFQDICGQRLNKVGRILMEARGVPPGTRDPLMEGPQMKGQGMDQSSVDEFFGNA